MSSDLATEIKDIGKAVSEVARGFKAVLEGTQRELGRCLWCGFVFCKHEVNFSAMYYRVCLWPDDAPEA